MVASYDTLGGTSWSDTVILSRTQMVNGANYRQFCDGVDNIKFVS